MNSKLWFERAQKVTPGGVHSPVRNLQHVDATPIFFSHGQGAYLFDVEGNSYIDFCSSFGPHILGHSSERVVDALKEQVPQATSFGACHPGEVLLSEKIVECLPFLEKVRLVNSGTEAVMTAVRLARAYTGKDKIVKFEGCYHGHLDSMLAQAGSGVAELAESTSKGVGKTAVQDTLVAKLHDIETIKALFDKHGKEIAAVALEPIPANHGLWVPPKELLAEICAIARKHGALILFDEVISGFRVGLSGASGYFDIKPDIITLGKILGGGLPLAAIGATKKIMNTLAPLGPAYQAGTLSGNPLATAAGYAVLDELTKCPPYDSLENLTEEFVGRAKEILAKKYPVQCQQFGSIFWFYLSEEMPKGFPTPVGEKEKGRYAELWGNAAKEGLYLPPSPYEVGFVSTAHSETVLEEALEKLQRCVS